MKKRAGKIKKISLNKKKNNLKFITITAGVLVALFLIISFMYTYFSEKKIFGKDGALFAIMPGSGYGNFKDSNNNGYYDISNCEDLQQMNTYLSLNFELLNDIDCSEYYYFTSIGTCGTDYCRDYNDNPFTGTLNGNDFKITNLNIEDPNYGVGLFGYTKGANIHNIGLEVSLSGKGHVGALIGLAENTKISEISVKGSVTSEDYYAGGVAGELRNSEISNSFSEADVKGTEEVGAFVGFMQGNSNIKDSYSSGSVEGDKKVGGLVGETSINIGEPYTSSKIENSFTTSSVNGKEHVGALVGLYYPDTQIINSYYSNNLDNCVGDNTYVSGCSPATSKEYLYSEYTSPIRNKNIWSFEKGTLVLKKQISTPCIPDCTNKQCGSDGCKGSCGTCESGYECINGICSYIETPTPDIDPELTRYGEEFNVFLASDIEPPPEERCGDLCSVFTCTYTGCEDCEGESPTYCYNFQEDEKKVWKVLYDRYSCDGDFCGVEEELVREECDENEKCINYATEAKCVKTNCCTKCGEKSFVQCQEPPTDPPLPL